VACTAQERPGRQVAGREERLMRTANDIHSEELHARLLSAQAQASLQPNALLKRWQAAGH
jgi:hypothetical protein